MSKIQNRNLRISFPAVLPQMIDAGTAHADDINYWLKNSKNTNVPNGEDAAMIETFTKLFTNFAKTGYVNIISISVKYNSLQIC